MALHSHLTAKLQSNQCLSRIFLRNLPEKTSIYRMSDPRPWRKLSNSWNTRVTTNIHILSSLFKITTSLSLSTSGTPTSSTSVRMSFSIYWWPPTTSTSQPCSTSPPPKSPPTSRTSPLTTSESTCTCRTTSLKRSTRKFKKKTKWRLSISELLFCHCSRRNIQDSVWELWY